MLKKILEIILFSVILILSFSGFRSKNNSNSMVSEELTIFSAYSSNKILQFHGEISSTDFNKGEEFTINVQIKNMTNNTYKIVSEGNPIIVSFYKIGSNNAYAGTKQTRKLEPYGTIHDKITFKPEESGDYMLYIRSSITVALESGEKIECFNKVFLQKRISVK